MKRWGILLIMVIICIGTSLPVYAAEAEIYEKSRADALIDALPEETRSLMSASGISPKETGTDGVNALIEELAGQVSEELTAPLRVTVLLLAVVLLSRIVLEFAPEELGSAVEWGSVLSAGVLIVPQLISLMEQSASVAQALSGFLLAAVPVYTGIIILSGNAAVGSTYGALTLAAANGISALSGQLFLPLTRVFLALSAAASVTEYNLQKVTDTMYKCIKWTLILAVSLFTGVLSLQTLIAAQTDAVSGRAVKMIASSAIPIVGSAFGDALSVLSTSAGTVKSGIGAFGILAAAAVFLPLSLKIGIWILVWEIAAFAAELFTMRGLSLFLNGCVTALKMLLAVLFSVGAAAMISAAILLCVRDAYG